METTGYLDSLRPAGSKRSSKRDLIINVFLQQEGHLTADDLFDLIRRAEASQTPGTEPSRTAGTDASKAQSTGTVPLPAPDPAQAPDRRSAKATTKTSAPPADS